MTALISGIAIGSDVQVRIFSTANRPAENAFDGELNWKRIINYLDGLSANTSFGKWEVKAHHQSLR
jgi:hypothetical protein